MRGKSAPGSRSPPSGRSQISRDNRYREKPGGASAAAFLPMRPNGLAYHRRDNVPGNPGTNGPWTIRKITQGARPATGTLPCNLTR